MCFVRDEAMRTSAEPVKEYLEQLKHIHDYLKHVEEEIESILPISANQTDAVKVSRGYMESGLRQAEQILAKEEEFNRVMHKYVMLKNEIITKIQALPDAQQADLLYYRYVRFMPFAKVARVMHKEYNYTCRLHRKALISFSNTHHLTNDKAESANEEQ